MSDMELVYDEDDYLHVGALIMDYLRFLGRSWFILILLILLSTGVAVLSRTVSFTPAYSATVYYSLERTGETITDAAVASRVANSVYSITNTADFRKELNEQLSIQFSTDTDNEKYVFVGSPVADANLFTVRCNCTSPELANQLIEAFQVVFPSWIGKSVGVTNLTVTDEVFSDGVRINSMSLSKRILLAIIIGCGCWFVLASIRIFTVRKIMGEEDMYKVVDAKCFGVLPNVDKKRRDKSQKETLLIDNEHIDTNYLQAFRSMAARVEEYIVNENKKVLTITSTLEGEGSSVLLLNLAMVLRRHGKKVVVIDGNMAAPSLRRILSLTIENDSQGLREYLNGEYTVKEVSFHKINGFSFLHSGKVSQTEENSINLKRFNSLLKVLKENADVILIDSAPSGVYGDAILYSEISDAVLYVIRRDHAEIRDIRKSIEPFVQNHKLIGYVLNRVNSTVYGYGYKYGYGAAYSRYRNYGANDRYGAYGSRYNRYNLAEDAEKIAEEFGEK